MTTVLIVEDSPIERYLEMRLLEAAGVDFRVAEHGQQALEIT